MGFGFVLALVVKAVTVKPTEKDFIAISAIHRSLHVRPGIGGE
jgi:hypothetical protein